MPLPVIPSSIGGTIGSIKNLLKDPVPDAANDSTEHTPPKTSTVKKLPNLSPVPSFSRAHRELAEKTSIDKLAAANDEANQRSIERSQGSSNPLVPLISQISNTLVGMDQTLVSILNAINRLRGSLKSGLDDSGLGFDIGDIGDLGGEEKRGRSRGRRDRSRGGRNPRGGRSIRSRMGRGVLGGLIGYGLGWGAGKLFDLDETQTNEAETAGALAGGAAGFIPTGSSRVPPITTTSPIIEEAGRAGGWFGKMGNFLKSGAGVASKVLTPLRVGLTVSENMDELKQTGAVDPLKQLDKLVGGLAKVFDTSSPFFSMSRLEGLGEAVAAPMGAVYGIGTQIGKGVHDLIPEKASDSVVDSIVGLFGGETQAVRDKKQKEASDKMAKEYEDRKKAREQEKKKKEELAAASAAAAITTTSSTSDAGKLVEASPTKETTPAIVTATERASSVVMINQPADKPVPVLMTDEKGTPLVNSVDRREGSVGTITTTPNVPVASVPSNVPVASVPSNVPVASVPSNVPVASVPSNVPVASVPSNVPTRVAPTPAPVDSTRSTSTRTLSGDIAKLGGLAGLTPEMLASLAQSAGVELTPEEVAKGPDYIMSKIGQVATTGLHQNEAYTHNQPSTVQRGPGGRGGVETQRTNNNFGVPNALSTAQTQAAAQDIVVAASTPTTPAATSPVKVATTQPQSTASTPTTPAAKVTQATATTAPVKVAKSTMERFNQMKGYLQNAANVSGVNAGTLAKITNIESRFDPYADAKISPAKGLGQFLTSTWVESVQKYGAKYGVRGTGPNGKITKEDAMKVRFDPGVQAGMLAEYSKEGIEMGKKLGASDADANVYAHHNLGPGGAKRLFAAVAKNPNAPITSVLTPTEIKNNPYLYKPGMTAAEAYANLGKRMREGDVFAQKMGNGNNKETLKPSDKDSTTNETKLADKVTEPKQETIAQETPKTSTESVATTTEAPTRVAPTRVAPTRVAPTRVAPTPAPVDSTRSTPTRTLSGDIAKLGGLAGLTPEMLSSFAQSAGVELTPEEVAKGPDYIMSKIGQVATTGLHQNEAYTHNLPGHQWSTAQRGPGGRGGVETQRTNNNFGGQPSLVSSNPISDNTVSGLTPLPANIPSQSPPGMSLTPRAAQNYNLLNMPKVRAAIDALKAGGANIASTGKDALESVKQGASSALDSGMSMVDSIRQNGALNSLLSGDIAGLVDRVAPELSPSLNGIRSTFDKTLSQGSDLMSSIGGGLSLPKSIPDLVDRSMGSLQNLGNTMSSLLPSSNMETSPILENSILNDKTSDIQSNAYATAAAAQNSGLREPQQRGTAERGSSMAEGQTSPIEVRNPESSIRKLTDLLISYTYG